MQAALKPSRELLVAAGESPATIRVNNIRGVVQGPRDAWGRRNRPQPVSVSVTVCMSEGFGATPAGDALASDTVHYGLLSKAVLSTLARLGADQNPDRAAGLTLPDVVQRVWADLTGLDDASGAGAAAFLNLSCVRSLEVTARLDKATLQGDGVSLARAGVFAQSELVMRGSTLKLHGLRVPALIGVNGNEREARQAVVADVAVERFDEAHDAYCDLETVVVKVMTDSAFETIEALVADLAAHITAHLVGSYGRCKDEHGWHLRIGVEKPIAVVFADAPCVELSVNTNDVGPTRRETRPL
ncbi:uncharacterized protein UV8b_02152 [Ustilaginoidea virens]|uniref:Dihydroneopterin aldolase/epimerase domain-containing protein n=1 Tax=Ustilaginoidea virens TaxID=1159556 RepID=A0A8E5MFA7_USTVR|nr:uncharacterized protein UV8b_02152 [Ustilaginoidea virens]QUC17911.1 hypothetical protein UV8b_02152 [Ustilaginoidea virens]